MFYSVTERASLIVQGLVPSASALMYQAAREHLDDDYDPRLMPVPLEVYEFAQRPFREYIPSGT